MFERVSRAVPIPSPDSRRIPIVSAMMPAYNVGNYIADAIESVVSQTLENWELVIVDDGSTDDTLKIASQFNDARIRVFHLDSNVGRGAARNLALGECTGSFVAICDADDISLPERFESQVREFNDDRSLGVVASQVLSFYDSHAPVPKFLFPESDAAIRRRFARGHCGVPNASAMIRRDVFVECGPYRREFLRAQDHEFFLRALMVTRFRTSRSPLVLYRQSPRELSLAYWRETVQFQRYAYYLSGMTEPGEAITFSDFVGRARELAYMRLIGSGRFGYLKARSLSRRPRRLA